MIDPSIIIVPIVLFIVVVCPIWIVLHYSRSKRVHAILAKEDREELGVLEEKAETMSDRIETLESILDNETPTWRRKNPE